MTPEETVRAWTDRRFLAGLSESERASLPPNPAGFVEISEPELSTKYGLMPDQTTNPENCTAQPGCTFRYPCEEPPCQTGGLSTCDPGPTTDEACPSGPGTAFCGC